MTWQRKSQSVSQPVKDAAAHRIAHAQKIRPAALHARVCRRAVNHSTLYAIASAASCALSMLGARSQGAECVPARGFAHAYKSEHAPHQLAISRKLCSACSSFCFFTSSTRFGRPCGHHSIARRRNLLPMSSQFSCWLWSDLVACARADAPCTPVSVCVPAVQDHHTANADAGVTCCLNCKLLVAWCGTQ